MKPLAPPMPGCLLCWFPSPKDRPVLALVLHVDNRGGSEFYELTVLEKLKFGVWILAKSGNGTSWRVFNA